MTTLSNLNGILRISLSPQVILLWQHQFSFVNQHIFTIWQLLKHYKGFMLWQPQYILANLCNLMTWQPCLSIHITMRELQRSYVVATPIYFGKLTFSHELATHNIFVFVSLKLLRLEKQGQLCSSLSGSSDTFA